MSAVTALPFGATSTPAVAVTGIVKRTCFRRASVTDISLSAMSMRCAASAGINPSKSMLTHEQLRCARAQIASPRSMSKPRGAPSGPSVSKGA